MAKSIWSNEKIFKQLDSGAHWSGGSLTYSFPTSASGLANGEAAGFSPLNGAQQAAATLAMELWDNLIAPNFTLVTGNTANVTFANIQARRVNLVQFQFWRQFGDE
jgi:serralysin